MIIIFRSPKETKPVLEIDNRRTDQIVIRFISVDEHITVHRQNDGTLLRTHYHHDKSKSTWDEIRVETARQLDIRNPQRHGKYVVHAPLPKIDNVAGYHLVGRLVDLHSLNPRQRYFSSIDKIIDTQNDKFMLTLYLSAKDNPYSSDSERVTTQLGDICLVISELSLNKQLLRENSFTP